MAEADALLALAKTAAGRAAARLLDGVAPGDRRYTYSKELPREIKTAADLVLDQEILKTLQAAGLPILTEESGYTGEASPSNRWFIVDPLDGTFNFVKRLGPCAVSIALWQDQQPIFGVIYDLLLRQLAWGGPKLGAFADDQPITVSEVSELAQASICTGFPARFDVEDDAAMQGFIRLIRPFSKVRMLGSAASALLQVARGSADAYVERDIMLWDVAAGIAIVEGAGGVTRRTRLGSEWRYDVVAANPTLLARLSDPAAGATV